ncbi:MAG: hypothetical protein Q4F74_03390 [Synergistaceae bacterium]|nr:hypothetical protein [Synergistaceae bacterium]
MEYKDNDVIEKITIDYRRITDLGPRSISRDGATNYAIRDYSEHIIIDRKAESLEHTLDFSKDCHVSRTYHSAEEVSTLLDSFNAKWLFACTRGGSTDSAGDKYEIKEYKITVEYRNSENKILSGTFDRNGLPSDFPRFAALVKEFLRTYSDEEILDPSFYDGRKISKDKYIYCSVVFNDRSKSYYYRTNDETLKVGDIVEVPVGLDGRTGEARIVEIGRYAEENVPHPIAKTKIIIGRYSAHVDRSFER